MEQLVVGIVDVQDSPPLTDAHTLAQWAVDENVAMVTGWFGCCSKEFWEVFANLAGAANIAPMYTQITLNNNEVVASPSYYIFFGPNEHQDWSPTATAVADTWKVERIGYAHFVKEDAIPLWYSAIGFNKVNRTVPNLGKIKMKEAVFDRWFDGCFQTVLWIGSATSSHRHREKHNDKKGTSKGKGAKGKCGKGQDRSRGKGKCNGAKGKA